MRHIPPLCLLLLLASALPAAVTVEERGEFIKIQEIDGAETVQLLYLRKKDVGAVTYGKTGFNRGEMTIIMRYQAEDGEGSGLGYVLYRIDVPPNKSGEAMADRIIKMIEPDGNGQVIKREVIIPGD